MASSARQKPLILTAAEADQQRAEARAEANARLAAKQTDAPIQGSGSTIVYFAAAVILLAAGYLWFSGTWNTTSVLPTVTETIPSPDIDSTISPAPQTTPPPADAPATNP